MGEDPHHHLFGKAELDPLVIRTNPALGEIDDLVEILLRRLPEEPDEELRHLEPFRRRLDLLIRVDDAGELHRPSEPRTLLKGSRPPGNPTSEDDRPSLLLDPPHEGADDCHAFSQVRGRVHRRVDLLLR